MEYSIQRGDSRVFEIFIGISGVNFQNNIEQGPVVRIARLP